MGHVSPFTIWTSFPAVHVQEMLKLALSHPTFKIDNRDQDNKVK